MVEMSKIELAFMLAEKAHANQSYSDFPYMYHIKMVYHIGKNFGFDDEILIGCILHDTMKNNSLTYEKISNIFSENIANVVYDVTSELGKTRKEQNEKSYPKIYNNWKAAAVKLCSRIANLQHSITYNNTNKIKFYLEERESFYNGIHNTNHNSVLDKAWTMLNSLYNKVNI